jgi:hypothetical protein
VQNLPQYFVSYDEVRQKARTAAKAAKELVVIEKEDRSRLSSYELREHGQGRNVAFLILMNKRKSAYVAVDAENGAIVDIL